MRLNEADSKANPPCKRELPLQERPHLHWSDYETFFEAKNISDLEWPAQ